MDGISRNVGYTITSIEETYIPIVPRNPEKWGEREQEPQFPPNGYPHLSIDNSCVKISDPTDVNKEDGTEDIIQWEDDTLHDGDVKTAVEGKVWGSSKQSQMEVTLKWLEENYERADGVCLPRCVLYTHYLDLCKRNAFSPAGAANFGKIIRQRFPKLTTRRLGTRGQSKYHYYGIGIKETSIYYHSVYRGKGLTRFSGTKVKTEGSSRKYSLSSKTGTLLPDFPKASDLVLDDRLEFDKVQTFIMMYRTHCQRILDSVISANFDEVQNFLLHFWQGMPEHLLVLLREPIVTELAGLCDSILYKVLIDVLVPSTIQDLPDSLNAEIKAFVRHMPVWLSNSLEDVPDSLRDKKLEAVRHFSKSIKRQLSFVHLAQTARTVLQCSDTVNQMAEDLEMVEFDRVCAQVGFVEPKLLKQSWETVNDYFNEFRTLLSKQAAIEGFTEWLENLVETCVIQPSTSGGGTFREAAARFVLHWSIVSSLVMRDLTLHSAKSFGSFHLLHMTFNEYLFLVVETQEDGKREQQQQRQASRFIRNAAEISMQAKVRTQTGHPPSSPKVKRKRESTECANKQDPEDSGSYKREPEPTLQKSERNVVYNGTAFTRPLPTVQRDPNYNFSEGPGRHLVPALSLQSSPIKHAAPGNGGVYQQPSYISSLPVSLGAYHSDYVSVGGTVNTTTCTNPRMSNYEARSFSHGAMHAQNGLPAMQISGNGFNMAANGGHSTAAPYWGDASRAQASFSDHYTGFSGYNKYGNTYEGYGRESALLRGGPYQDSFGSCRSAFDPSRGLYGRGCDNITGGLSGSAFGMTSYNSNMNYMDIAPPGGQYGRQDAILHPHLPEAPDFYGGNHTTPIPTLSKTFVTPFR